MWNNVKSWKTAQATGSEHLSEQDRKKINYIEFNYNFNSMTSLGGIYQELWKASGLMFALDMGFVTFMKIRRGWAEFDEVRFLIFIIQYVFSWEGCKVSIISREREKRTSENKMMRIVPGSLLFEFSVCPQNSQCWLFFATWLAEPFCGLRLSEKVFCALNFYPSINFLCRCVWRIE